MIYSNVVSHAFVYIHYSRQLAAKDTLLSGSEHAGVI